MFDARIKSPARIILAGPSECGKTYRAMKILEDRFVLFDKPEHCEFVYYFYNLPSPTFDEFKEHVTEFINECPTKTSILEKCAPHKDAHGCIIVIDDFGSSITKDLVFLTQVASHQYNISVLLLVQNLFPKEPLFREVSLNSKYLLAFSNPRDPSQFMAFAKQFMPENTGLFMEAVSKIENVPYAYLQYG